MSKSAFTLIKDARLPDLAAMTTHVYGKELALERDLHRTKWFDYRFLSPLQATQRFYESFQEIYRREFRRNVDAAEAPSKTGVSSKGLLGSDREITSFWRARQFADGLGGTL